MTWAAAVSAISLAVIALTLLIGGMLALRWMHELRQLLRTLERRTDVLDREARPALQAARVLFEDASRTVTVVRAEVEEVTGSARELRQRVTRAVRSADERLRDLEALLDVVQYEVEETALDIAAALRTTRRSASLLGAVKRAFGGRGR